MHITVGAVRYNSHGRDRSGVCSVQFAERIQPGDTVPIYLKRNPNFKFPKEGDTPVIMIGPGTGIAPFRAYMQEKKNMDLKVILGYSLVINTLPQTSYIKRNGKNG